MSSNVKDVIYSVYRIRMSDYRIISADENFEKLTGYTEKDYRENQLKHTDLIPAEDIVEYIEKMMQIRRNQNENIQEHRLVRKNGDIIVVFCYGKIYKDEKTGEVQAQIIVSDVTDTAPLSQVKTESSSYMEISEHDMLTGLYNRGSFEKRVNHDLALFNDGNCAIIVMDIRELKWINDTYGRSAGDMVINNMAANMVSIFRSDVVMSRIGGDEFCLYIPLYEEKMQQQYMDKIMLGSISSNVQVGFYENAEKIINVPMSLIMAFGVVLMPRIANMVTSKDKGEVFKLIDMSMEAVMLLAIAISFGLAGISFVLAPIFFGYEFEECGILIMGLAVTVPFMAFANVIRTQYLIPYKEDKIFVVSLFLGAAVNLIVNIILIPYMAARGAVIGTIFAEIIVCIYQSYFVRKKIFIKKYLLNTIPPILIGIVMFVFVFQIGNVMNINIVTLILQLLVGMFIYAVGVFLLMLKSRTRLMVLLRKFVVRY